MADALLPQLVDEDEARLVQMMARDYAYLGDEADGLEVSAAIGSGTKSFSVIALPTGIQFRSTADEFLRNRMFDRSCIALENATERVLLDALVWWYKDVELGRPATVFWQPIHGGGDSTDRALEIVGQRPALALVDSDCASPDSRLGQTCRKVLRVVRRELGRVQMKCYPGREIENLIPAETVALAMRTTYRIREIVACIRVISEREPLFLRYFDWKKGLRKTQLMRLAGASRTRVPWHDVQQAVRDLGLRCFTCNVELFGGNDECCGGCVVLPGLGTSLLTHVSQRVLDNLAELEPGSLRDDWVEVARTVFAWGLASESVLV